MVLITILSNTIKILHDSFIFKYTQTSTQIDQDFFSKFLAHLM